MYVKKKEKKIRKKEDTEKKLPYARVNIYAL